MKKLLSILCAVVCLSAMLMMAGCGESAPVEEESTAPAYPITVEDNDLFTFEITGYDSTWDEFSYKVTNKAGKDIILDGEKVILNDDTTTDAWIYCDIAEDTSASEKFYVNDEELADGETGKLKVKYSITDNNTYETIDEGSFTFEISKK